MLTNGSKKTATAIISGVMAVTAAITPFTAGITSNAATANDNYAKLLQQSLYFYDANMCGSNVDEVSQLTWRGDCHTGDDVDGGFHDAGDHVMFGLPQGYTASTLGWSYYEFKDAYDTLGQTGHFKTINDYFCKFFKDSTVLDSNGAVTKLLYQKGEGNSDHSYWGAPEKQSGNRKQYWSTNGASDIAAEYAAALAISYINFGDEEDLKYAEALYKFSTKYNSVATYGTTGFYTSSGCGDDQAWAAGWLYLATKTPSYKSACASKQQSIGWAHSWDNVALGAACVNAHITGDWSKVNGYLNGKCNSSNYLFMDMWGSARLNTSIQLCALVASKNSTADYNSWCKGQMNYILGNNPADTCFVVGYADNSASKPHHRACSGTYGANSNVESKYVLVGALVGGPSDASGTYADVRADYVCNEVALDYNAGLVGAAAGLYDVYGTGAVETAIVGAKPISDIPVVIPETKKNVAEENTQPAVKYEEGSATAKLGEIIDRSSEDTNSIHVNIGAYIPEGAMPTKFTVNVKASSSIGELTYGVGVPMTDGSDWYQEDGKINLGTKGTVEFDTDYIKDVISTDGEFMFGMWWSNVTKLTVESVKIDYAMPAAETTAAETTTEVQTTTTEAKTTATEEVKTTVTEVQTTTEVKTTATEEITTAQTSAATAETEQTTAAETAIAGVVKAEFDYTIDRNNEDTKTFHMFIGDYLPEGALPTSFIVNVKSDSYIGELTYGVGVPMTDGTDWYQIDGKKNLRFNGQIVFDTADISEFISTDGEFMFGMWWSESTTLDVESVEIAYEMPETAVPQVYTDEIPVNEETESTATEAAETVETQTTAAEEETETSTQASPIMYGDVDSNGVVDITDAIRLLCICAQPDSYNLTDEEKDAADVYQKGDGINGSDVVAIQKFLARLIISLPESYSK